MRNQQPSERLVADLSDMEREAKYALPPVWPRLHWAAGVAMLLLLAWTALLFLQVQGFVGKLDITATAGRSGEQRLQAMGQHLEQLRTRFNGLLAESVEVRLRNLEKRIDAGQMTPDDARVFSELDRDFRQLESLAVQGEVVQLDSAVRDHDRFRTIQGAASVIGNDRLIHEIVELKGLVYLGMVGLASGMLGMAGYYWYACRRNLRQLRQHSDETYLLPRPAELER